MKTNPCRIVASLVAVAFATIVGAQSNDLQNTTNRLPITIRLPRGGGEFVKPLKLTAAALSPSSGHGALNISTQNIPPGSIQLGNTLPYWTYNIKGSRDNDHHLGVMVGTDPFRNPATSRIPTYIIPVVFTTHSIATSYDPSTGYYTTARGETTIDPTKTDQTCLAKPNNVPVRVIQQSPILTPAPFVFGGTNVGNTQYVDAFQRANFWGVLREGGEGRDGGDGGYHVLLSPVITLPPVHIDVPATAGLALTDPNLFEAAYGFSYCAPMLLVDLNWFDSYLNGTVTPKLQQQGVIAANDFPIYLSYNSAYAIGDVTFIGNCCAIGYHSVTGVPILDQTYGVVDFDTTGWFLGPPAPTGLGTSTMSHEVGEWMNDPFGTNQTAPWGGTGQVAGCQANLEVGDPLSGTDMPTVTMSNGYTYSLQEMAFFSWFFGAPSIGVNGWFSNNGTFAGDAGPNCPTS